MRTVKRRINNQSACGVSRINDLLAQRSTPSACNQLNEVCKVSTYVIAEAGVNHNGDPNLALELVDVAAHAGADAVKFQTFEPDEEVSATAPKADYQRRTTDAGESQLDMIRRLKLRDEDFIKIASRCKEKGIAFLSSPFDARSIDFLTGVIGVDTLKVPSGEVTNGPYLLAAARTKCNLILSTGMANLVEVKAALSIIAFGSTDHKSHPSQEGFALAFDSSPGQQALRERVSLLQCTTEYPAPYSAVNLRAMDTLASTFGLPVGLSDHSDGIAIPLAAVGRGACIIEKHFTISKTLPGPDHQASLEPDDLRAMIIGIRQIDAAIGNGSKEPQACEFGNMRVARRSLVARTAIRAGDRFTETNLCAKRPGVGQSPMLFWEMLDQRAERDYAADDLI